MMSGSERELSFAMMKLGTPAWTARLPVDEGDVRS